MRNIIFMIGDGMGLSQIQAALTTQGSLNVLTFPFTGFVSTFSANDYNTDSAAAGTAISTGEKTKNGMLGMSTDTIPFASIMENAHIMGYATGIVVTCSITHATPAAFYAHQPNREMGEEIANDLVNSGFDLFIGGGSKYFNRRSDNKDLTTELKTKGYNIVYEQYSLDSIDSGKVVALLADDALPKITEGRGEYLSNNTEKAISLLEKKSELGFFLMIEGSQIDWGGHANDKQYTIDEVIDFDNAVKVALEYAKRDGNTLVIVTADHETGGMVLLDGNYQKKEVEIHYATKGHTGIPVPVFAFGPGAEEFTGYFDNTEFKPKIERLLNF